MEFIPRKQIEEQCKLKAAFSIAADAVIETALQIRKQVAGHESFRCTAAETDSLPACELKTELCNALDECQQKARTIGLDFAAWQQNELGNCIDERSAELPE